jgi:hypothetical protein
MIIVVIGFLLLVSIFYLLICLALSKLKNKDPVYSLFSIANIIGFCILGIVYFFVFDLQWGLTWQAVIFGLPLLAGMAFLIIDTIFMIKKKNWKLGLRGFGIGWAAFVLTGIILIFFSYLIVGAPQNGPKETENTEENKILELVLKNFFDRRLGYAVIDPSEQYWHFKDYSSQSFESMKNYLINTYKAGAEDTYDEAIVYNINSTFNKWIELNPKAPQLTIKSSPQDGYYIDYDGKFSRYFENISSGWMRWHLCRPFVGPSVDISLPAYDPHTGIIIMYIGQQADSLMGAGSIYLFRYQDGELKELNRCQIWVS